MKYRFGVSYFSNRMPEHFAKDLEEMRKKGCNQIMLTFSENDQEYYQETIKEFVSLAHSYEMEVALGPWGLGKVFGGEAYSNYVALYYDERQELNNGDRPPCACLNNPHFRKFFVKWLESAIECGTDAVFYDEPHFFLPGWGNQYSSDDTSVWGCCCQHCRKIFEKKYGDSMPEKETETVKSFKREMILDFITFASRTVKQLSSRVETQVCLITDEEFLHTDIAERLASIPELDEIGTDPYWGTKTGKELDDYLAREFTQAAQILASVQEKYGKKTHLWIKNFLVKAGTEYAVKKAVDIAIAHDIRSVLAWSYKGTRYMSIRCDDSHLVWETLTERFQHYQAQ